jgi:tRNA threonylcarbamoyl adenosine modification protein YjeE
MVLYKKLDLKQVCLLAQAFAKEYRNKDMIVGFSGVLGSGKTTFIKEVGKTLGVKKIKSPSFIVMAAHKARGKYFYHLDLYRLNQARQLDHLGVKELFESKNRIIVIEWVEKFPKIKKICDVNITITINKDKTRNVKIT